MDQEVMTFKPAPLTARGPRPLGRPRQISRQTPTPTSAGDLPRRCPVVQRQAVTLIDEACREPRSQAAFLLPGIIEQARELLQIPTLQARLHIDDHLLDMMQRLPHRAILLFAGL